MLSINNRVMDLLNQKISLLESHQSTQGYFIAQSINCDRFDKVKSSETSFITSLILLCLKDIPVSSIRKRIIDKGVNFLLIQRSSDWSFNYWIRDSISSCKIPYPDDLDCTFCALSVLYLYRSSCITGKILAKAVSILTTLEEKTGGPYRTWLVSKSSDLIWIDIDPAVNANVAYFLSLHKVELPRLNKYVEKCIVQKKLISPYYEGILPVIYFISRFYQNSKKQLLIKILEDYRNSPKFIKNPLQVALIITSFLNLGIKDRIKTSDIEYLIKTSQNEWKAYPFIIESRNQKNTQIRYVGSSDLTTAFCLEALGKYTSINSCSKLITSQTDEDREKNRNKQIYSQIVRDSEYYFNNVGCELKKEGLLAVHKILTGDIKRQITLLPYYFSLMLGKDGEKISTDLLVKLGVINLFGWVAYTIYDNFLDDEGNPVQLSIANFLLREITTIAGSDRFKKTGFLTVFQSVMNEIDSANTWETQHCRVKIIGGVFPNSMLTLPKWGNYEKLAERSYGHALGPLAILWYLGFSDNSTEVKNLRIFFTHYLIARQLNDDAHDWEADLKKGQLNPVVCLLISKYRNQHHLKNNIKLTYLITQLNGLFWYEVLPDVCKIILSHIREAKKALRKISVVENSTLFEKILDNLEITTENAVKEQKNTVDFLHELSI